MAGNRDIHISPTLTSILYICPAGLAGRPVASLLVARALSTPLPPPLPQPSLAHSRTHEMWGMHGFGEDQDAVGDSRRWCVTAYVGRCWWRARRRPHRPARIAGVPVPSVFGPRDGLAGRPASGIPPRRPTPRTRRSRRPTSSRCHPPP